MITVKEKSCFFIPTPRLRRASNLESELELYAKKNVVWYLTNTKTVQFTDHNQNTNFKKTHKKEKRSQLKICNIFSKLRKPILQAESSLLRWVGSPLLAESHHYNHASKKITHKRPYKFARSTFLIDRKLFSQVCKCVIKQKLKKNDNLGYRGIPAVTKRRLYCMRLWARPRGFFFLSCFATFGVWPLTFPARASDPWTLPAANYIVDYSIWLDCAQKVSFNPK